ncbi:MAG: hypothetical protein EOM23_01070 [Candidatus Moranbacteria bacterium]|nr:hypothetical protein [Candidatus Moranbacteria bacterium]
MKKGGILITIVILLVAVGVYFLQNWWFDRQQTSTSDSGKKVQVLRYAKDSYIGYAPLEGVEMKKALARNGIALKATDDGGDYQTRLKEFADGKYDFIVLPINAYIEHGMQYKFPGVVVAGIAESTGADGIVGFEDLIKTGKVNDLNDENIKIAYVPASPSSFLIDLTIADFGLDQLANSNSWRREFDNSNELFSSLQKAVKERPQGKGNHPDFYALWEPELSKATKLGLKKIWGSDQFRGYIIDVFVFHRDFVNRHPSKINDFLTTYFDVMAQYQADQKNFIRELASISSMSRDEVSEMLPNIHWYDMIENCSDLFGLQTILEVTPKEGLINSIISCNTVMYRMRTITENITNPYLLVNSSFLEKIRDDNFQNLPNLPTKSQQFTFDPINESQFLRLKEVGTIRIEDISFRLGSDTPDELGESMIDNFALMLVNNYPQYRLIIKGHTGEGDDQVNMLLSQARADMVRQRLIAIHNINPDRILAKGYGSSQPPVRKPNENIRLYKNRWARVEFVLVR